MRLATYINIKGSGDCGSEAAMTVRRDCGSGAAMTVNGDCGSGAAMTVSRDCGSEATMTDINLPIDVRYT